MIKLIDLTYYAHTEFTNPSQVLKHHEVSVGYAEFIKDKLDLRLVKHLNYEGQEEINGVKYIFFKSRNKFWHIPFATHRFIKKQKPDVVLSQGLIFPLQILALRFKIGKKCKIIVQHHAERPYKGIKRLFQRIADRFIDAYMFTSLGNAAEWIECKIISDSKKCFEIVEVSTDFKRQNKYECRHRLGMAGEKNFLWVGNLIARKDPVTVLKAFNKYLEKDPDARLYMIYRKGELLEKVNELIVAMPALQTAVRVIGNVAHEELSDWFTAADFFLLGSHSEGSGTALIEAMACGCIPVVTDIPPFRKITDDGKLAFLSPPGNIEAFLNSMKRTETTDKERFSEELVHYFEKELSFRAIAEKVNRLCQQLMTK
jgi:glycosyltransferase involved in cell wall biosynthesis